MTNIRQNVQVYCPTAVELPRPQADEYHFIIENDSELRSLCEWTHQHQYVCTMVAANKP